MGYLENSHAESGPSGVEEKQPDNPTNTPEPRSGERPTLDLSRPSIDRYMPMAMSASQSVSDEKAESNDQPGDRQTKPTLVENAKTTMQNGGAAVTNALQNGGAAVTNALTSVWKGVTGLVSGKDKDEDEGSDKVEEPMTPKADQVPNVNQASPTTSQASDPAVNPANEIEDEKPTKWNPFGTSDPAQPADSVKPAPAAGVTGVSESQAEEPKLPEAQPAAAAAPTKTKGGWFSPFSNALGGMKEKLQNLTGQTKQSDADEKTPNPEAEEPKQESKQTAKRRRLCVGYTNDGVCPLSNEASSTNMCTPCYNRRPL